MAELLILDIDNWMDKLPAAELAEKLKDAAFKAKYDMRSQSGDVVEIREDGGFKNADKYTKFRVVKLPGVKKDDVMYLLAADQELSGIALDKVTISHKKRFSVTSGAGKKIEVVNSINELSVTDKKV